MSYLALYRKYRPQDFLDFAGQEEITKSLQYQVKTGTFGHCYLFSGIRGTGKTSMAKVLAKAVNCLDPQEGNPCGKCQSCLMFDAGGSIDIVEMDAASNNGVDDIRELRENARFLPATNKYKVYIIDEVQMLSTSAFNALLKTLEEPSPSVLFILATTELHKIPETILSRCMRYTFKRIQRDAMVARLAKICEMEGVSYETAALELLSEHAGGALRDAISLMDKSFAMARGDLTEQSVRDSLGLIGRDRTHELLHYLFSGELDEAMLNLGQVLGEGKEISMIFTEILSFLRSILLSRLMDEQSLVSYLGYSMAKYKDSYSHIKEEELLSATQVFDEASRKLRLSNLPRLTLEMAMVQVSTEPPLQTQVEVKKVVEKRQIQTIKEDLPPEKPVELSNVQLYWEKLLENLRKENVYIHALLIEGIVDRIDEESIRLTFHPDYKFHRDKVMEKKSLDVLGEMTKRIFGKRMKIYASLEGEEVPKETKTVETQKPQEVVKEETTEEKLRRLMGSAADRLEIR